MKNTITIGTIWQDERTKKYFELVAHSKENNRIQLSTVDNEQSYTTMTEASLRKHYKLIALSMKQFRPETQVITLPIQEPEEEVKEQPKEKVIKLKVAKETVKEKVSDRVIRRIKLEDGKIISGNAFVAMYGKNGKDIKGSTIAWILKTEDGKEMLKKSRAIVITID